MNWIKNSLLATTLSLLTGCGTTPPTHFYVLSSAAPLDDIHSDGLSLGVGPVKVANYLDRVQIALKTDNALMVDDFNHWAEPLAVGVQRVMMEELAVQLGTVNVVQFPWRADEVPDLRVKILVLELNRIDDKAIIKAAWSLARTDTREKLYQGVETLEQAVHHPGYDALVRAYSSLLHELSISMASVIRDQAAHPPATVSGGSRDDSHNAH